MHRTSKTILIIVAATTTASSGHGRPHGAHRRGADAKAMATATAKATATATATTKATASVERGEVGVDGLKMRLGVGVPGRPSIRVDGRGRGHGGPNLRLHLRSLLHGGVVISPQWAQRVFWLLLLLVISKIEDEGVLRRVRHGRRSGDWIGEADGGGLTNCSAGCAIYRPPRAPLRASWGGGTQPTTAGQRARLPVRDDAATCSHAFRLLAWPATRKP